MEKEKETETGGTNVMQLIRIACSMKMEKETETGGTNVMQLI